MLSEIQTVASVVPDSEEIDEEESESGLSGSEI